MISNKKELLEYLQQDAKANKRNAITPRFIGDYIWKFIWYMRHLEYYENLTGISKLLSKPLAIIYRLKYRQLSLKLGYSIPLNTFGKGLSIAHVGTIIVNGNATIGENCRIHDGVTIGSSSGSGEAPQIGDNVFIATGAKLIGDITIANDVAIGANAVVVKSIKEAGTTWAGVPAKKISDKNSHSNLSPRLFD